MIKILFFIETLKAGGAEKVMIDLVNHMDQSKFDITVQTVWPSDAQKYLVPGIRYKSMYAAENKSTHLRYRAEAEAGIAYRLHIKDDYDIECAYLEMGPTKVMSASTNKKAKKLAWVHCDLSGKVKDVEAFVSKSGKQYRRFDEVICVSETARERFRNLFGDDPPSRVLYNVFDDEGIRRKAQELLNISADGTKPIIAAVGRLSPEKGYDRLLCVSRRLLDDGVEHEVWLIGEGPERASLERYAHEHQMSDHVRFLGFQSNPYPYMKAADLGVCSSHFEGFSTFAVECMILGKPFVTTECSGMREILGDSQYGLITDNHEEAFYKGLKQMILDEHLRQSYAEKAANRGKVFSAERLVRDTEAYFMKLAGK